MTFFGRVVIIFSLKNCLFGVSHIFGQLKFGHPFLLRLPSIPLCDLWFASPGQPWNWGSLSTSQCLDASTDVEVDLGGCTFKCLDTPTDVISDYIPWYIPFFGACDLGGTLVSVGQWNMGNPWKLEAGKSSLRMNTVDLPTTFEYRIQSPL